MGEFELQFPAEQRTLHLHPDRLWIWEEDVYLDENRHPWLSMTFEIEGCFQVLLQQKDVSLGEPKTPSQLRSYVLPLMWQLYPGSQYRGSDSSYWRIVYHVEFGDIQDMLLEKLPDME
ncbi:PREDICTED: T-cell leukemia/lymphoma protein 1A [Galeopterus variegatus]|uniref:T-cell leukemia/lymphoma protein 1A n=1 Tax=Galeopterus variegatus TaxID=482537 RepID=A0ABM0RFU2_GALVR|nr:PREDICTED: T-cell leukemia/lymphoma protein 1A [Galeopterus variegatus]